jgi:hypothetical protein
MARLAWELLTGSCRQLRIGFAGQLPEPPRADGDGHADARRAERDALQGAPKLARLGPDGFVVAFPYDAAMNAQVKALPADQRRWADGAWQVSTSQAEVVARLVSGRHFAISATAHHLLEQAIGQPISAALPTSTSAPVARAGAPNHSALVRMVDGASR